MDSIPAAAAQIPEGVVNEQLQHLIPALSKPPRTRIVVLGCGVRAHFPWGAACRRYDAAVKTVMNDLDTGHYEIVRSDEPFEDADRMLDFLGNHEQEGIDGVILFHSSFTSGEFGALLGRWLLRNKVPLLSWSFPEEPAERLSANSMCCQNFILGIFNTLGVKYVWFQYPVDAPAHPMIPRFLKSARAIARFSKAKLLNLGGSRVPGFYDCELDELSVMERFGVRVDRTDIEVVFDRAKKFDDAILQQLRDALVDSPDCAANTVPDEQIFQTLRLALGILDLAAEKGYDGCAVKSWPELFDIYGCASDGAVSIINDFGLVTTEEGDMNGLMSSMALHFISEGTAQPTLLDITTANQETNRLGFWHCGSCATKLMKKDTQYELRTHSILENDDPETAVGMMIELLLKLGDVTMVRYQYPESGKMYGWEGAMKDCPAAYRGSYGEMEPAAPLSVDQIMGTILDHGLDHHWSLGYGSWLSELRLMNHFLGVEEISSSNPGGMSGFSSC